MNNSELNQELKIGDTVQLKSGGPFMTIASYEGESQFRCLWFTGDEDKVREGYFPPDSLQLAVKSHKEGTIKGDF